MSEQSGSDLIAEERKRQVEKEGWTPEHDDEHTDSELSSAATAYVNAAYVRAMYLGASTPKTHNPAYGWPRSWHRNWWKPLPAFGEIITIDHLIRMLVKAGALICAEIDRLQRLKEREGQG